MNPAATSAPQSSASATTAAVERVCLLPHARSSDTLLAYVYLLLVARLAPESIDYKSHRRSFTAPAVRRPTELSFASENQISNTENSEEGKAGMFRISNERCSNRQSNKSTIIRSVNAAPFKLEVTHVDGHTERLVGLDALIAKFGNECDLELIPALQALLKGPITDLLSAYHPWLDAQNQDSSIEHYDAPTSGLTRNLFKFFAAPRRCREAERLFARRSVSEIEPDSDLPDSDANEPKESKCDAGSKTRTHISDMAQRWLRALEQTLELGLTGNYAFGATAPGLADALVMACFAPHLRREASSGQVTHPLLVQANAKKLLSYLRRLAREAPTVVSMCQPPARPKSLAPARQRTVERILAARSAFLSSPFSIATAVAAAFFIYTTVGVTLEQRRLASRLLINGI